MMLKILLDKIDFDSLFSSIERNEKRFCPNCGSEKVEPDERHTNNLGEVIFDLNKWLCNDCGYTGIMPLDSDEGRQDIEFDPKNQEEIDTSAGKGLFQYYLKILIPGMIIAYIVFHVIF